MKSFKILSIIALFSITFTSCTSSDEPIEAAALSQLTSGSSSSGVTTASFFKIDFDGSTWNATSTQAIVNGGIYITALNSIGQTFQISIPNGTVGIYKWNIPNTSVPGFGVAYNPYTGANSYASASMTTGTYSGNPNYIDTLEINIQSINSTTHNIIGTIKFTGVRTISSTSNAIETKVFTNGSFNLIYLDNFPTPTGNNFFAKINGVDFITNSISATKFSGKISISGISGSGENISVFCPDNVTAGTYTLGFSTSPYSVQYSPTFTSGGFISDSSGTLTIINHDTTNKRISGTFISPNLSAFGTTITHNITNGTFNITYP